MLPHKWTFFLKILVVLLAFAFVTPCALAADFKTELSIEDVSFGDKSFPEYQHDTQVEFNVNTTVYVKFDKVVDYRADPNTDSTDDVADFKDTGVFTHHDVAVLIYNETGQVFARRSAPGEVVIAPRDSNRHDGQNYTITFNTRDGTRTGSGADITPDIRDHNRVLVYIKQGSVTAVDPAVAEADSKNAEGSVAFDLVSGDGEFVEAGSVFPYPYVLGISTTSPPARSGFTEPFEVKIRLSEKPRSFTTDHIDVTEGKATEIIALEPVDPSNDDLSDYMRAIGDEIVGNVSPYYPPTGRHHLYYNYLVRIEPKFENKNDIVIKVKEFEDLVKPTRFHPNAPYKYTPPSFESQYIEGANKLTVKVGKEVLKDKTAGIVVYIPENTIIPEDGYLVVAKDLAGSAVRDPEPDDDTDNHLNSPQLTARQPYGLTYNRITGGLPNLEVFLSNGGTIDAVGPKALIISEIMWGSDASLTAPVNSQYIELRNVSGEEIKAGKEAYKLVFYGVGATLPTGDDIQDRVGTVGAGGYWSIAAGKGQSGRTGIDGAPVPTQKLISMQRGYEAATLVAGVASAEGTVLIGTTVSVASDGTMMSSWVSSEAPAVNFDPNKVGIRIGSPGREPVSYPATPDPEPDPTPVAEAVDIAITEIMVDTSDGRLPQWIELTNVSGEEKSLAGWSLIIMNAAADDAVAGSRIEIDLSGTLGVGGGERKGGTLGKSLLLVAWDGRNSRNLEGSDRVVDVSSQVDETGRYTLISEMAFMLALIPSQETSVVMYGDTAGNLGAAEAWEIPSSDGARSSLIRREILDDGMATMGTSANGWVLASDTSLVTGPATWYGSDEDAGTPGYDGGGPLPVELSHFRPARDKATGAVVITWSTQSELNNAGFFIKRSQQRDGEFKVINTTMIPGAGTTSEKQFYTYTDTTAQPNIVYYYQIEDVSLDGNRQTLTNGIRLKGHIRAAGKLTTTWGDLKTHE